jgi:hypothetical protein
MKKSELKQLIREEMENEHFDTKKELNSQISDGLLNSLKFMANYYSKTDKTLNRLFTSSYKQLEKIKVTKISTPKINV